MILFAASLKRQKDGRHGRSHEPILNGKPSAKTRRKPGGSHNSRSSKRGPIADRAPATSQPASFSPQ